VDAERSGDAISIFYDPMIAKLIVWDRDRDSAVRRLEKALADTEVAGLNANVPFLSAVAAHAGFLAADLDTRFIERYEGDLLPAATAPSAEALALFSLGLTLSRRGDGSDPWGAVGGFLLNLPATDRVGWQEAGEDGARHSVDVTWARGGYSIAAAGQALAVSGNLASDGTLSATVDGVRVAARWVRWGDHVTLFHAGTTRTLSLVDPHAGAHADHGGHGRLTAPMPGKVIAILVEEGATVTKGQPVIVLEAMKMEHTLKAPADGAVTHLRFQVGDQVSEGVELVVFEAT
jgi:3-methylcrotonyl-CoA carboxylase alpha subunit